MITPPTHTTQLSVTNWAGYSDPQPQAFTCQNSRERALNNVFPWEGQRQRRTSITYVFTSSSAQMQPLSHNRLVSAAWCEFITFAHILTRGILIGSLSLRQEGLASVDFALFDLIWFSLKYLQWIQHIFKIMPARELQRPWQKLRKVAGVSLIHSGSKWRADTENFGLKYDLHYIIQHPLTSIWCLFVCCSF